MKPNFSLSGKIVDVINNRIFEGEVFVEEGKIKRIAEKKNIENRFLVPGLVDAHIHIESSMLVPSEFAKIAVTHGTVATVSDPHEIANVLGMEGINFMIENGKSVPFKFYFGAPSCVPATVFESSGAMIDAKDIDTLMQSEDIKYLSEMMNFPGVLFHDAEVMQKLNIAKKYNKPVDGHAPGLMGEKAKIYIEAGISTDHECFTLDEALEKIGFGMKIQIREGSAAKNFETLSPLIESHPDQIMLCSDDKHPDDLVEGHINILVKRAIAKGYDPVQVIRICTLNPKKHYNLQVGLLQPGDPADLIIVDTLDEFNVLQTYINGNLVSENGKSLIKTKQQETKNIFNAFPVTKADLSVPDKGKKIKVQQALDGQIITKTIIAEPRSEKGMIQSDTSRDILKLVVLNRYSGGRPAIGFIKGMGLKSGAIASTVAHDSHNIIATGTTDDDIIQAIRLLIKSKGGISLANGSEKMVLPLPVGGIMSNEDGQKVAKKYEKLNRTAKQLGSPLSAPYMTLSFMALLVIPELKLSDKGLFDGIKFEFTELYAD
ncbi:MAG: adenine deaminase [Bacteroidales bacterium]|nr:adenine deaminase [Bacteroidales bacterium]